MINPLKVALPTLNGGGGPSVFEDFTLGPTSAAIATGLPFWGDAPDAWDRALIAGRLVPGRVVVEAKVKNRIDKKSIPGTHGAKMTHIGYEPAEVTLTIEIWTAAQLDELRSIVQLIRPRKSAPQPFTLQHPSIAMLDITSVLFMEVANLRPKGDGMYSMTITGLEYVPKGKKAKVVTADKPSALSQRTNALSEETDKRLKDAKKPSVQNTEPGR